MNPLRQALPVYFLLPVLLFPSALPAADGPRFNREIRPILSENCFPCHGPDSASRKADLRLDQREVALKAGVLAPGKPGESELLRRISSDQPDDLMPPPRTKKRLSPAEKDLLRRWIAAGAEYEPHWSLVPPARTDPPAVREGAWVRSPIDAFILAKLEEAGLSPAPEADRRTLARRLSLDLTGLPPSPEEVEAFAGDPSPTAYEALVERLMASPHWGEHRARYWLDAARYADTHGIHFDNYREMWSYREWVIEAFNRNLSFDRFSVEQLAGDLLPDPSLDQVVATGFNRSNMTTNEGGAISEEYLVLYNRDRTETTSQVWLGLTAGCAVCHNHKFDPLTQREFYELAAFFNNTTQAAMDGNIKDTPPIIPLPLREDRERWQGIQRELADADREIESGRQAARPKFKEWLASAGGPAFAALVPGEGLRFHASLSEGAGREARVLLEGQPRSAALSGEPAWEAGHVSASGLRFGPGVVLEAPEAGDFEKDQPFSAGAWVKVAKKEASGSIFARMDDGKDHRGWDLWFERGRVAAHLVHKWPEDALKVSMKAKVEGDRWFHVLLTHDGSGSAGSTKLYVDGVPQDTNLDPDKLKGTIRTQVPFKAAQRHQGSRLDGLFLQDLRIYGRALSAEEASRLPRAARAAWLATKPADGRAAGEEEELFGAWLSLLDARHRELEGSKGKLAADLAALRARGTVAHVQAERAEAAMAYVLHRGEYDRRRESVTPDTPDVLPPMPAELPRNRLGFARWLFLPQNPLTARVAVNRFWQEAFGTGLVRTAGDFGVSGAEPTHPELLDWLAIEFRDSGWDVKRFFKLLLTSATYRQSATIASLKLEKDPHNRLLSRAPRFRMDAEMIRDYALAASGLLVRKLGGPSVKPYQPEGVWEAVAMMESNTRNYRRDKGESLYRRSLYTFWKRAAPPASMEVLNAPSREVCTVRRERTNTPLQALVTLNDIQFFEAARHLAQAVLKGAQAEEGRLDLLARRVLSRPFRSEESAEARETLAGLLDHYRGHPDDARAVLSVGESGADPALDPALLAGWTLLANQILNLDEALNR